MNEEYPEQMLRDAETFRVLGDGKAASVVEQCRIMAKYFHDGKSLTDLSSILEATRQKLAKYAGAGKVMQGYGVEDQSLEWLYQISLFHESLWESVIDYALLVGLTATELPALRKMLKSGGCPLCEGPDETPPSEA